MSFSKAKIQRFNERGSEVPAPGAYNPKFDTKVKHVVVEKKDRFRDNKSVCSSGAESHISNVSKTSHISNVSKTSSNHVADKTQQLVKKRVIVKPQFMNTLKSKLHKSPISPKITSRNLSYHNAKHKITDLTVDCANKEKTIRECGEQIRQLELDLELHRKKDADLQQQHQKEVEQMEKIQQQVLKSLNQKYLAEIDLLKSQLVGQNQTSDRLFALEEELVSLKEQIACAESSKEAASKDLEAFKIESLQFAEKHSKMLSANVEFDLTVDRLEELSLAFECSPNVREIILDQIKQLEADSACPATLRDLVRHCYAFQLKCIESLSEACKLCKSEYDARESRLCQDLSKENNDLRQQLEYNKIITEEQQRNLQNIKPNVEMLTKWVDNLKKSQEIKEYRHQTEVEELKQSHHKEIKALQTKYEALIKEKNGEISKLMKVVDDFMDIYETREKELTEVKKSMTIKVEEVKKHADKMIKNAEAVTRETLAACRSESEERVKKIIAETDSKANIMYQEGRNSVSEEMRSAAEKYEASLKKIEAEKESLEQKLAEKESEITWMTSALEELKTAAETQECFSQSLQAELDRVETELAEKKEELRSLKDKIRSESAEMVSRRRRFEVVMAENQASINALMQRVAESNAEVERLQRELKEGEMCMHEHRDLLNAMRNNSKHTSEQVSVLIDQLDSKRCLIDQMEINNLADIELMRVMFEKKVDSLKQIIAQEVERLEEECKVKNEQNIELRNQLKQMGVQVKDAQGLLLKLEERCDEGEIEVSKLQLANGKLERALKEKEEIASSRELAIIYEYEEKVEKANKKISNLSECVDNMQESIALLQTEYATLENEKLVYERNEQQLKEELEKEKSHRINLEEQILNLTEACERYNEEYQEISDKYSEILIGHNNIKQRVKHVAFLKDKILTQQSEILRLKQQLENKNAELLKATEKRSSYKGKENVQKENSSKKSSSGKQSTTPLAKSTSTAVTVSASSPLGPLRHRNE